MFKRQILWGCMSLLCLASVAQNNAEVQADCCHIAATKVEQGTVMTAIGAADVPLLRVTLSLEGTGGAAAIEGVMGRIVNTTARGDIRRVKAYLAPDAFDLHADRATLLAQAKPRRDGTFCLKWGKKADFAAGTRYVWVTADVWDKAKEGHSVDLALTGYLHAGGVMPETAGNPEGSAMVFLGESVLFYPGDWGSRYYRIPAIATAGDGSLVAVCDRRWNSNADLPNNIDVVARRSTDMGHTWSQPQTLAGTDSLGGDYGHGDPAIVFDKGAGRLVVLVTSHRGFFYSKPDDPALLKVITSDDNGRTWSPPRDITSQIYGSQCPDSLTNHWYGAFVTSGAALQTRSGSLLAAIPVREVSRGQITNYVIRSDDHGRTWRVVPGRAATGADEAKLIERTNGDLLISVRHGGDHIFNVSHDGGASWEGQYTSPQIWGTACNGDMIRYTAPSGGTSRNILLQTIPWAKDRRNVSVLASYDEGKTWLHRKTLCSRGSAYSALCVLPDGTVGCYIEDESVAGGYTMHFVRFSLGWLETEKAQ